MSARNSSSSSSSVTECGAEIGGGFETLLGTIDEGDRES
jgi:hypothetical protein